MLVAVVLWHATLGAAGGRAIDAASGIVAVLATRSWRAGHASRAESIRVLVAPAGTLVVTGFVLLVAAIGLERGRRELLERIREATR